MKTRVLLIGMGLAAMAAGCHEPAIDFQADRAPATLHITAGGFDPTWDETLEVLREYEFAPDRQDVRAGLITTHPTVSQQFFEFWRADAQGGYQWLESSLHNIRRWVEVRFEDEKAGKKVSITVHVQRKSQPERQVTTASGALQIYREKLPIYTGERLERGEGVRWIEIGWDSRLAHYLLDRIERRLAPDMVAFAPDELAADQPVE